MLKWLSVTWLMVALGLAWLASVAGSAVIIGAFAAGLLLRETKHAHEIEHGDFAARVPAFAATTPPG